MNTIIKIISIFAFITCVFATCKKKCNEAVYTFATKAFITQHLDSIRVNDTVWLEVDEPITLKDITTNQNIDFGNTSGIGITISVLKFTGGSISNPGVIYATNKFEIKIIKGAKLANSYSQILAVVNLAEESNRYLLKCGIVAKDTGTFALSISNAGGFKKSDNCTKADFKFSFSNSTDQHLYLYQNNRPGYQISQYEQEHMYCFKVK
jgi:hypothetical protein